MPLILDDGDFESGNTLVTLDFADQWHAARGNALWAAAAEPGREQALIRCFDWLKTRKWDLEHFFAETPPKVMEAQCAGALKELAEPGILLKDRTAKDRIKRDVIEGATETEYFAGEDVFTQLERLIAPYLLKNRRRRGRRRLVRGD